MLGPAEEGPVLENDATRLVWFVPGARVRFWFVRSGAAGGGCWHLFGPGGVGFLRISAPPCLQRHNIAAQLKHRNSAGVVQQGQTPNGGDPRTSKLLYSPRNPPPRPLF